MVSVDTGPLTFRTTFNGFVVFDGNAPDIGFTEFENDFVVPVGVPPELSHLVGRTVDAFTLAG